MSFRYRLFGIPANLDEFAHKIVKRGKTEVDIKIKSKVHYLAGDRYQSYFVFAEAAGVRFSVCDEIFGNTMSLDLLLADILKEPTSSQNALKEALSAVAYLGSLGITATIFGRPASAWEDQLEQVELTSAQEKVLLDYSEI